MGDLEDENHHLIIFKKNQRKRAKNSTVTPPKKRKKKKRFDLDIFFYCNTRNLLSAVTEQNDEAYLHRHKLNDCCPADHFIFESEKKRLKRSP